MPQQLCNKLIHILAIREDIYSHKHQNVLKIFSWNQRPKDTGEPHVTVSNAPASLFQLGYASLADN